MSINSWIYQCFWITLMKTETGLTSEQLCWINDSTNRPWMNQHFIMNHSNEWISESLNKTVTCHHLLNNSAIRQTIKLLIIKYTDGLAESNEVNHICRSFEICPDNIHACYSFRSISKCLVLMGSLKNILAWTGISLSCVTLFLLNYKAVWLP